MRFLFLLFPVFLQGQVSWQDSIASVPRVTHNASRDVYTYVCWEYDGKTDHQYYKWTDQVYQKAFERKPYFLKVTISAVSDNSILPIVEYKWTKKIERCASLVIKPLHRRPLLR